MKTKIYTVLIVIDDIDEGIAFVNLFPDPFCFYCQGTTYDNNGNPVPMPTDAQLLQQNEIYITVNENAESGQLYVDAGFLKYYKFILE